MLIVIETLLLIVFGIGWILAIRKTSPSDVKELMAENRELHKQLDKSLKQIDKLLEIQKEQMLLHNQQLQEINTTLLLTGCSNIPDTKKITQMNQIITTIGEGQ